MAFGARFPVRVQPQVWVNDNAMDVGLEIGLDAHDAMTALSAPAFRRVAEQVFGHGHDYDELALGSESISSWISAGKDNTFVVHVEREDFEEWLKGVGLDRETALSIDEAGMEELRSRAESAPFATAP